MAKTTPNKIQTKNITNCYLNYIH